MLQIDATFLVIFFIIWILVFLLTRIFWRPLTKLMSDRETAVQTDWAESRKAFAAYEQSLQEVARELKRANAAADAVREELKADGLKEKARLAADAGAACRAEIERAKAQLAEEALELKKRLESEAARLAGEIERKLLS